MSDMPQPATPAIPDGFAPMPHGSEYGDHIGPFLLRRIDDTRFELGLMIEKHHMNGQGFCHGGVLMGMADTLLGSLVWWQSGKRPCATLTLNTDFVGNVKQGDFIVGKAEVTRLARSVAFVQGELKTSDGKKVMTATGVWKFFDQK